MKRNFITAISVAVSATLSVGFVNITPTVIYGDDNRKEVYEVESAAVRDNADSTVAMINIRNLVDDGTGYTKINARTFGETMNLCSSEPYFDQPSAASCSGSLVGPDLIATAGHCISNASCSRNAFVFGYNMIGAGLMPQGVPSEEVYRCQEIVAHEYTSGQDYALVRVDRVVRGHRVLSLQRAPAQPGDQLYVIGHPAGLPTKVADGAEVRSQHGSYFKANLDTYGGNSGSAVFNAATHEVVGILVRGAQDYIRDSEKQCTVSNRCSETGCRGEDVTNISYIVNAL